MFTTCSEEEVVTDLWEQIRNTAWKKNGDPKPTLGFYAPNKGPGYGYGHQYPYYISSHFYDAVYYYDYFLFEINRKGDVILSYYDNFHISVSDNGERLTIKGSRNESRNGTYTLFSSDPNFNWFN
jgi:hypothetical protein